MANIRDNTALKESPDDIAKENKDNPLQALMRLIIKDVIDGKIKIN